MPLSRPVAAVAFVIGNIKMVGIIERDFISPFRFSIVPADKVHAILEAFSGGMGFFSLFLESLPGFFCCLRVTHRATVSDRNTEKPSFFLWSDIVYERRFLVDDSQADGDRRPPFFFSTPGGPQPTAFFRKNIADIVRRAGCLACTTCQRAK